MWESSDQAIDHVKKSLALTQLFRSKIDNEKIISMEGHSGSKTRHFYNNLLNAIIPLNYLEVGSYMGSSFISAMYKNTNAHGIAVDNFDTKYCVNQEEADKRYNAFLENISNFLTHGEDFVHLKQDFRKLDLQSLPKLDVYLFDGDHCEQDQYDAFKIMYPCFADICVVIIDDYNQLSVQSGTEKAFAEMPDEIPFEVKFKHIITYTKDGSQTPRWSIAFKEFWNGMGVFVLEKSK